MSVQNKQEQMYCDIVQLVADISREGFGIDVVHNRLFSGVFRQQLEKHHNKIVSFIEKYVPVEITPPVTTPSVQEVQQEHIEPKPVIATETLPDTKIPVYQAE